MSKTDDLKRENWAWSILNDPGATVPQKRAARAVLAKLGWDDDDERQGPVNDPFMEDDF